MSAPQQAIVYYAIVYNTSTEILWFFFLRWICMIPILSFYVGSLIASLVSNLPDLNSAASRN